MLLCRAIIHSLSLLYDILVCECIIIYLHNVLLVNIQVVSSFLLLQIILSCILMHSCMNSLRYMYTAGVHGSSTLLESATLFSKVTITKVQAVKRENSHWATSSPVISHASVFKCCPTSGDVKMTHCGFNLLFPEVEQLFACLWNIHMFCEMHVQVVCSLFFWEPGFIWEFGTWVFC